MTDAREIIARQVRWGEVDRVSVEVADNVISALTSAGFRILGPDEIDGPTLEKCAAEVKHLRQLLHSQTITLDVGREDTAYFLAEDAIRALQEKRT